MVAKGNTSGQAARARRGALDTDTSAATLAPAPVKLKKKVVAVRSDAPPAASSSAPSSSSSAASSEPAPTSDASPTTGESDWAPQRSPAKRASADSSPPYGFQHQRERADRSSKEEPQVEDSEAPASLPLVAIAPAKPGTMLPKDLIMAKYRVKPDAPKFLLMLYEILQHESTQVIRWTEDGLALQILDQANVTEKVLPKYFNHTNFHSFQRQLNYFGFRKWTKSKTDICTFSHPYFRRNQPELMHLIKRKKATRRAGTGEQGDVAYPAELYATGAAATATGSSTTSTGAPKKLLPLSPSGKRRLPPDASEDGEHRAFHDSRASQSAASSVGGSLPALSSNQAHAGASQSSGGHVYLPVTIPLTPNAISPASGGAKKKAKTGSGSKSFSAPELAPSGSAAPPAMLTDPAAIAALGIAPGVFPKGALPNLDLVRNRLIYRQPQQGGAPGQVPGFTNAFPIAPNVNPQLQPAGTDNSQQNSSSTAPQASGSGASSADANSMFSNSFSDPVDILLRIKKSRAMSQDNTLLQSPQQSQGQVEGFASLQNFLLSQSMYTNRLESQLKLAVEENEALRHLVDAKQREVEALLNERKMIQNENAVLTEDKNKLFEINRDLLSKLFPQ